MKNLTLVFGLITAMIGLVTTLVKYDSSPNIIAAKSSPSCIDSSSSIVGKQAIVISGQVNCINNLQIYSGK